MARGSAIQQLRLRGVARLAATGGGTAVYTLLGQLLGLVRQATGGLLAATIAHGVLDVLMFAGMVVRRLEAGTNFGIDDDDPSAHHQRTTRHLVTLPGTLAKGEVAHASLCGGSPSRRNGAPASGAPAGFDLALLRVHNPDAAAALASAVNDWLSAEWLAHELRLRAALVVPSQQQEMAAREIERLGGHPDAP